MGVPINVYIILPLLLHFPPLTPINRILLYTVGSARPADTRWDRFLTPKIDTSQILRTQLITIHWFIPFISSMILTSAS